MGHSWSDWKNKNIRITVNDLNISGSEPVCYSPNKTYTVSGYPGSSTFSWSKSNNLTQVGGSTSSTYTGHAYSSSTSGEGNVQVIVTNSDCQWTKTRGVWVGVPDPTITGEQYPECDDINWYFLDPEDQWGTYYWNVTSGLTIIGSPYGYKAQIRADEGGTNAIYCDVTNGCGTDYGSLPVYVDCFGFRMTPNPADDYVEISLDENKVDISNITEYEVKIFNIQQFLIYQTKTKESSFIINTSEYIPGTYSVQLIYNGKAYSQQLIINH